MSAGPLAVLPLGATEQHGPHLPAETDTLLATAAARALLAAPAPSPAPAADPRALGASARIATRADAPRARGLPGGGAPGGVTPGGVTPGGVAPGGDAQGEGVLLPALAYGASGEHQSFPGTVSLGTDALAAALLELGRSACTWASRLLVVNGHGGNVDALRRAVARLRYEGRDAAWLACRTAEDPADTHAGHAETSLLLHLHPELVRADLAEPGCIRPLPEILPAMRAGGVAAVSANGVLGDPTAATAVEGARLWDALLADARGRLDRWAPDDDGMLR